MAPPAGGADEPAAQPLLAEEDGRRRGGGATSVQTLGNVVVSIVGTGVLGLPYAFRAAGWVAGSLGVAAAGFTTLYCMFLLVSTDDLLRSSSLCLFSVALLSFVAVPDLLTTGCLIGACGLELSNCSRKE